MLEIFKNWINMILGLGILFTLVKIIMPNSKLKKYIYAIIGIVTIIVILNPVINVIKSVSVEKEIKDVLHNMSSANTLGVNYTDISNYEAVNKNNIKESFGEKLAEDMKQKLKENIENETEIKVSIGEKYEIETIVINIKGDTSFDIVSYISVEYDIEKSKITLKKGE